MKPIALILSCEHASNDVPKKYQEIFSGKSNLLKSHEGFDFGAVEIAQYLSEKFACPLFQGAYTRLLIDLNRSVGHAQCFSKYTASLPEHEKENLVKTYYYPYRQAIIQKIQEHIANNFQVLHLSIHSFTPVFKKVVRNAGLSFLYDPKHHAETELTRVWTSILSTYTPSYKIRKNYPYRGNTDGLTTTLRKKFDQTSYLGIEIECNQALLDTKTNVLHIASLLGHSLSDLLEMVG